MRTPRRILVDVFPAIRARHGGFVFFFVPAVEVFLLAGLGPLVPIIVELSSATHGRALRKRTVGTLFVESEGP
jgi:hypothetical protein